MFTISNGGNDGGNGKASGDAAETGITATPIAAISTPRAQGGIAVIRVSGGGALRIAAQIFRPDYPLKTRSEVEHMAGYTACYGTIPGIDECVLLCFRAPHSYTGEDTAEFQIHGGEYAAEKVLETAILAGAKPARGGEFTYRAYMNGKISLTQAEAVADIISADNAKALALAQSGKIGRLDKLVAKITSQIKTAAAETAAYLDYPDEFEEFNSETTLRNITEALNQTERLITTYNAGTICKNGIPTAIIGKTNAGKSSIMNGICGRERSIVTDIAGTTRDVVEDYVNIDGVKLNLADCAGLRGGINSSIDIVEKIGIDRMRERAAAAELIIAVFDGSREYDSDDAEVLRLTKGKNCIFIVNKADLAQKFTFPAGVGTAGVVYVSALREDVLTVISKAVKTAAALYGDTDTALMNERQLSCAAAAAEHLRNAKTAAESGMTDVCGVMAEYALASMAELTGDNAGDSVIAEVFSRFCVGK